MLALNVYTAMCYHKLDYYDVSQEMLATYVQMHPDSIMATNLKACNNYRLYSGKAAEAELKQLMDQLSSNYVFGQEIIKHNIVIFRNGDGALQVLPSLIGIIPEAKLNLAVYHLKHGMCHYEGEKRTHFNMPIFQFHLTINLKDDYAVLTR